MIQVIRGSRRIVIAAVAAALLGDRVEDVRRRRCSCHGAIIFRYRHTSSRKESGGSCQMTIVTLVSDACRAIRDPLAL